MYWFFNTNTKEFDKQEKVEEEYEVIEKDTFEKSDDKKDKDTEDITMMQLKNMEARMLELEFKVDDILSILHEIQQRAESPYKDCHNYYDDIALPLLEQQTQTEFDKFLSETLEVNLGNELIIGKKNFSKSLDKTDKYISKKPLILKCFDKIKESKTKPKVPTRIRKSNRINNKNLKVKKDNNIKTK
tara:strand:- start:5609 stop:6169 length:561 start_codon:yes stop_codon:yes gene_type:complete